MQCDVCNGSGQVTESRSVNTSQRISPCPGDGFVQRTEYYNVRCSKCGGTGYCHYVNVEHWCSRCNGTGQRNERREIIQTYPTGRQLPTGKYTDEIVTCNHCSGSGREIVSESRPGQGEEDRKKEGCFITTAVCNEFDNLETHVILNKFRAFRDNWLAKRQDGAILIAQYYKEAPEILDNLDSTRHSEIMKFVWDVYLNKCLSMIEEGKNNDALQIYQEMLYFLKNETGV